MIVSRELFLILAIAVVASVALPAKHPRDNRGLAVPPKSIYQRIYEKDYDNRLIAKRVESWTPKDKENVWELSGLFEGDIMLIPSDQDFAKNGLLDKATRWPGGIIPIYITEADFDEDQLTRIRNGLKEYHEKTCLRFRPYEATDEDYVIITGKSTGCWSMVGRQRQGQELNLQPKGCLSQGTIVHELLHALGFYHQQSATNRDEYVVIHWDNIPIEMQHNFLKYKKDHITDFNIGYDYGSVMHYGADAFSSNGKPTITPLEEGVTIGQRKGLSEKDLAKLQKMYEGECAGRQPEGTDEIDDGTFPHSLAWLSD